MRLLLSPSIWSRPTDTWPIAQLELVSPPTDPISAVKFAPNSPTRLLVASWDKNVYLYDVKDGPNGKLIRKYPHRAAVLDVCFGADDNTAFTAGLDWDVNKIDLETGEMTLLSSHEKGVKSVAYSARHSLLISACLLYTSPSPRDGLLSRMPSSA